MTCFLFHWECQLPHSHLPISRIFYLTQCFQEDKLHHEAIHPRFFHSELCEASISLQLAQDCCTFARRNWCLLLLKFPTCVPSFTDTVALICVYNKLWSVLSKCILWEFFNPNTIKSPFCDKHCRTWETYFQKKLKMPSCYRCRTKLCIVPPMTE